MLLVAAFLFVILLPYLLQGSKLKRWQRFMNLISQAPETRAQVKTIELDIDKVRTAIQIIESWFPHSETEAIDGAPLPIHGRLHKSVNVQSRKHEVELEIYYPISYLSLNIRQAKAQFIISLSQSLRGGTEISFEWQGAETAISDLFSTDYQVLHYLIDRTEQEFFVRNYKEIPRVSAKTQARSGPSQKPKQWWRTYNAGPNERVYSFWPTPQDYLEAVQNPLQNFKDESIQNCLPALSALGIPRVQSGMFACVYEFSGENQQWAVRCFTTRLKDQQERYKAISSFILADDLPYTVDFHYLEDGIKCGDTWFPILKMTWVEGQTLDTYLRENLRNRELLERLRLEFQIMMERMRTNNVAHGDLQHGNILISDGEIYLVDYDGFFVPELAGRHNNELGHPNYQHPQRTEKYFGPYLDNFSAQLIDISLICLIEDPSLFNNFNGGDECLLFRKADFSKAKESRLLSYLQNHESAKIKAALARLLDYLQMAPDEVPFLCRGEAEKTQNDSGQRLKIDTYKTEPQTQ